MRFATPSPRRILSPSLALCSGLSSTELFSLPIPVCCWHRHPDENSPAEQRLEVGGIALDVAKTLQLVTTVALRVERLTLHSRWQPRPEAPPHWVQQFGPPLASCARAAESHNQSSGVFGQAERAVAEAASGSDVAARMSRDHGHTSRSTDCNPVVVNIRIADPAGMPNLADTAVGGGPLLPAIPNKSRADLTVLAGNLIGCPVPSDVSSRDTWGASYVCAPARCPGAITRASNT